MISCIASFNGVPALVRLLCVGVLFMALAGCAIKLAPDYDKSIVDGLVAANKETLTLFASVSEGAQAATFDQREDTYNSIIGQFDALRLQISARPVPRSLFDKWFNLGATSAASAEEVDAIERTDAPSEDSLIEVIDILTRMRDDDKKGSLTKNQLEGGYRGFYEINFQQALTYEQALER